MAADSPTTLMDPRFRNIFDLGQCDRHCRMYRSLAALALSIAPAQAWPRARSRLIGLGRLIGFPLQPVEDRGTWDRLPIPQLFDFILGEAGGRSRVVVHHSKRGRSTSAMGHVDDARGAREKNLTFSRSDAGAAMYSASECSRSGWYGISPK